MPVPTNPGSEDLLGDLESIRTLLDDHPSEQTEDAQALPLPEVILESQAPLRLDPAVDAGDDDSVPVLDEVVELSQAERSAAEYEGQLTDDVFSSLLEDGWKAQADDLLADAREAIDERADQWSPNDTDELNDALRVRIDQTIYDWMQKLLADHIDELRSLVLTVMSDEIQSRVTRALEPGVESNRSRAGAAISRSDGD